MTELSPCRSGNFNTHAIHVLFKSEQNPRFGQNGTESQREMLPMFYLAAAPDIGCCQINLS